MKHHESVRQADFDRVILTADVSDVHRNLQGTGKCCFKKKQKQTQGKEDEDGAHLSVGEDDASVAVQSSLEGERARLELVLQVEARPLHHQGGTWHGGTARHKQQI